MPFALTLAFAATSDAQNNSWTNRYTSSGNSIDTAFAIAVDTAGNVFVTGYSFYSGSGVDYTTIKYSSGGVPLWTNRYNGPGNNDDAAYAIALDGNDNVFVTGSSLGSDSGDDYATIKYSNDGLPLWTNRYNGLGNSTDTAYAMTVDGSGNVFVTGYSLGSVNEGSRYDYATVKYSNEGLPLWTNRYDGPGNGSDIALAIAADSSGNAFVTGTSARGSDSDSGADYATIKYSSSGALLWVNRYGAELTTAAKAIAVDNNGNVLVTGESIDNGGYSDYATIKYSNAGVSLWTNRYNGVGNKHDNASAIAVDGSGNVFVTGYSAGSGSGLDYATIKYSDDGVPLWTNRYNGPVNGGDTAEAIAVDGSGNVFVTGHSDGGGSSDDFATIAYSGDGVALWTNRYSGLGTRYDQARDIAVDHNGNVFVAGYSTGANTGQDYVTIKYAALPPTAILENPQVAASEFSFHLVAEPSGQFAIQVSTNLVNWEAMRQVTIPASGSTNIVETAMPQAGQMYYRAQRQ